MVTLKLTGAQAKWVKDNLPGFIETFEEEASEITSILVTGSITSYNQSFSLIFMSDKTASSTICTVDLIEVDWKVLETFQFIGVYQEIMQRNPKIARETDPDYIALKRTITINI